MDKPIWMRQARDDSGQAMVELALVFVVLSTLIFGGIEFGRAFNAWAIVTQASREGARTAAVRCTINPGCATTVGAAIDAALAGLDPVEARWDMDPGPYVPGTPMRVSVEYDIVPLVPLVSAMVPGGMFTVTGATTMRLE